MSLATSLDHSYVLYLQIIQELSTFENLLMQSAVTPDEMHGNSSCTPPPFPTPSLEQPDPKRAVSATLSPDPPLRTFAIELSPASLDSTCSDDDADTFLAQPPHTSEQPNQQHHEADNTLCLDGEPLPLPPFNLLTPVQQPKPDLTGKTCLRLSHARTLLSHACSSGGASVDSAKEQGGGGQAAKATNSSGLGGAGNRARAVECSSWRTPQDSFSSSSRYSTESAGGLVASNCGKSSSPNLVKVAERSVFHQQTSVDKAVDGASMRQTCSDKQPDPRYSKALFHSVDDSREMSLEQIGVSTVNSQTSALIHMYTGTLTETGDFVLDADSW